MAAVETLDDLRQWVGQGPIHVVERHGDLEHLLARAHVDCARGPGRPGERGAQPAHAVGFHLLKQVLDLGAVKRDIARLYTVIRERELGIRATPAPVEAVTKAKKTKAKKADAADKAEKEEAE